MRQAGVLQATRIVRHPNGTTEQISVVLGPEPIGAPKLIAHEPTSKGGKPAEEAEQERLDRKRQRVFDIRGVWMTDEQLKYVPDTI